MNASTQRRELRQQLLARRQALSPKQRIAAAQGLRHSLELLPEYLTDTYIAGYWAVNGELPLNLVIPPLAIRGQQFLLPSLQGKQLRFLPWQAGDKIQPNKYGIPEPAQPQHSRAPHQLDLVLLPLLGFDRFGQRLGYGGGYYDRSFAFLKNQPRPATPILVGVAYTFQELKHIEANDWDISLDFVATESELITCHPNTASQSNL